MMQHNAKSAHGFSLLELMLVVGLVSVFMMGMVSVFDSWSERAINRKTAGEILRVQNAAAKYVSANYGTFINDTTGVFTEIPLSALTNGVYLPTSFNAITPYRQSIKVYKRKLQVAQYNSDGTPKTDLNGGFVRVNVFEVLTITGNVNNASPIRVANKNMMDIVQAGGIKMGVYSQINLPGTTFVNRITSPLKDWYINYSSSSMLPNYTASPDALGGYLAAYEIVSTTNLQENENYLYRVDIPGKPELNQMRANLMMNGRPIQNVNNLTADRVVVSGNAALLGESDAAGNTLALTVDQALRLNGTDEHRINMKTASGGCGFIDVGNNRDITGGGCSVTGGEMQVISAQDARLDVNNSLRADGSVITDISQIGGTSYALGTSTFDTVEGFNMTAHDRVIAPDVYVSGTTINTQQMQAGFVGLYDTAPTGGLTSYGGLTAAKVTPGAGYNLSTPRLDLGNVAQFNENLYAGGAQITRALDFNTIETPLTLTDTVLSRTVQCTYKASNGKTYCEPTGSARLHWNGRWYDQECTILPNGYRCNDWLRNTANTAREMWLGECTYLRDENMGGKALHQSPPNCTYPNPV